MSRRGSGNSPAASWGAHSGKIRVVGSGADGVEPTGRSEATKEAVAGS